VAERLKQGLSPVRGAITTSAPDRYDDWAPSPPASIHACTGAAPDYATAIVGTVIEGL